MVDFQLSNEQKELANQLSNYSKKIKQAYEGAVFSLNQKENPDRFVHFAHSLREVIDLLAKLNSPRENRKGNQKFNRKSLLQSVIDPIGKQSYSYDTEYQILSDAYGTLSSIAHHSSTINEEKAIQILNQLELILKILTTPQIQINDDIDKIISNPPNDANAKKLKSFQIRWATNSYLIENLPVNWLPNMLNVGFFDNPQPAIIKDNHLLIYPIWFPSRYLVMCAKDFPDEVYKIISEINFKSKKDQNPAIYADFLECLPYLELSKIEKIVQKSLDEKWYDITESHFLIKKYIPLIEKLFLKNKLGIAIKLLEHTFYPKLKVELITNLLNVIVPYKSATYSFEEFLFEKHFKELIEKFTPKEPLLIIKSLIKLLSASIKLEFNDGKLNKSQEHYSYRRLTIDEPEQNFDHDIKFLFAFHLAKSLAYLGMINLKILKKNMSILQEQKFPIFRKLELYLYSLFPNDFKNEIEKSLVTFFDDENSRHEYYNLIKKTFNQTSKDTQEKIFNLIDAGFSKEEFEREKSKYGEKTAQRQERRWKFTKLESIADYLDEEHQNQYSELSKEFLPSGHQRFSDYRSTQIGAPMPNPTIFGGKSIEEVFEKIKSHSIKDEYAHEDNVVRFFGDYVERNPLDCSKKSLELKDSEPIFHYELFFGLTQAIKGNSKLDWNGILQLIENDVKICHKDKEYTSKSFDEIREIYSLLETGLKKNSIEFSYKDRLWKILQLMTEIGTRCNQSEIYPEKDGDSLTISLNDLNGMSFHVIYQYAVWCESNSESKRFLAPEVKQVFVDYLDRKLGGHTISRHAVLGIFFPNFYYLDSTFVKGILEKIVSGRNTKIAFWDAYVSWNDLKGYLFEDLYAWYNKFLNGNLISFVNTKYSHKKTIDHVTLAYFYDLKNADEIFEKFLNDGKIFEIEYCVSQLAYIMKDKETDEKFNKEKLIKLWHHPSILKQNLHMWFRNNPLDPKITIELYLEYLKQYSNKINLIDAPISELQKYVKDSPKEVTDCIEIFIDQQEKNYIPEGIKEILKSLLKIDNDVKPKCQKIVEKLATLGFDWRHLLAD